MIVTDLNELRKPNVLADIGEIDSIIYQLEQELLKQSGVGLAAPQIGIHKQVAIIRTKEHSIDLINPIVIEKERPVLIKGEGCLSLPGIMVNTYRFDEVFVKCDKNPAGIVATGLEAVTLLHEIDHLNGILMIDRSKKRGTGRNDPCPCGAKKEDGSPLKLKRCHER